MRIRVIRIECIEFGFDFLGQLKAETAFEVSVHELL